MSDTGFDSIEQAVADIAAGRAVVVVDDESFSVGLIPATLKLTVLGSKSAGDPVNLEVDVIAKYVEKMLGSR